MPALAAKPSGTGWISGISDMAPPEVTMTRSSLPHRGPAGVGVRLDDGQFRIDAPRQEARRVIAGLMRRRRQHAGAETAVADDVLLVERCGGGGGGPFGRRRH